MSWKDKAWEILSEIGGEVIGILGGEALGITLFSKDKEKKDKGGEKKIEITAKSLMEQCRARLEEDMARYNTTEPKPLTNLRTRLIEAQKANREEIIVDRLCTFLYGAPVLEIATLNVNLNVKGSESEGEDKGKKKTPTSIKVEIPEAKKPEVVWEPWKGWEDNTENKNNPKQGTLGIKSKLAYLESMAAKPDEFQAMIDTMTDDKLMQKAHRFSEEVTPRINQINSEINRFLNDVNAASGIEKPY